MSEIYDLKTYLDVKEGEELDVFRYSAKLCILRSYLIKELTKVNKELDQRYMSDESFLEWETKRFTPKLDAGFWGPLVMGTVVAGGILSNVFGWTTLLAVICLGGAAAISYLVISNGRKKARATAENELIGYRAAREEHNRKVPELRKSQKELPELIAKCVEALKAMEKNRECITEKYWPVAPYLLNYVDTHRADNLKEALRVYEDELYAKRTTETLYKIQEKQARMEEKFSRQLREMEADVARAELQSDLSTIIALAAIYESSN